MVADGPPATAVSVPWIEVADARPALAALAAEFFEHPSRAMSVVGVTGTNGKTTTAYLLRAIFDAAGKKCGLLGTVTYATGDSEVPAARTTPEAPDVQRLFRQMVDARCAACVMEVSSHALVKGRVGMDLYTIAPGGKPIEGGKGTLREVLRPAPRGVRRCVAPVPP